jgi:hypothetical protein
MDPTSSSFVKPESPIGSPFDVQGFKNLLETLKKSKRQQNPEEKTFPNIEE